MGSPDYEQLSKWLQLFGQNIAVAMVMAAVQAAVMPWVEGKKRGLPQIAIGILFGCSALVSTSYPMQFAPGVLVDMRNVFVFVGALSGGPIGAAIAAGIAIVYRLYLGGIGAFVGVSGLIIVATIGALVHRRYGLRARELGVAPLAVVGFATGIIVHFWALAVFSIMGIPLLPVEASVAIILLYPVATVVMGMAINTVRYNVLRQTESRLRDIMETTSDLIWETDAERRITYLSDRYQAVIGYAPAELMGKSVEEVGDRWLDDASREIAEAAIAAQKPYSGLYFLPPTKNGSRVIFMSSARPHYDHRGRFAGYRGTATDVTELKNAEEEVRQRDRQLQISQERLTAAQQIAKLGSIELDYSTGALYWSDEVYRILGLDPAHVVPSVEQFRAVVHPDDRPIFDAARERVLLSEDVPPGEFRVILPSGEIRWIYRQIRIIGGNEGKPRRSIAALQDVTERKKMEEALRDSREHLTRAQQLGKIGSAELDLVTGKIYWSDEMYKILARDRGTIEPSFAAFADALHPEDRELALSRAQKSLGGLSHEPIEYRLLRGDGEARWIYLLSEQIRDLDGRPTKILYTCHDITDAKRAEEERARLASQLTQAQKMEAVGNLTGGIAHDFNNLLSVILGRLEMAEAELPDRQDVRDWIRICLKAAQRGASLTRSMLAFSRQQPLKPEEIDVSSTIADMLVLLTRALGETIKISVTQTPNTWHCEADPSQLQSALLNLALNARDAMPGGGEITIAAENTHLDGDDSGDHRDIAPGDYVALSVTDTGCGMPTDVVAHAFEPFFTTKEVGKGSGLGLSMVYGFVKQSGGHVKIDSAVGRGTTISLYLPRSLTTHTKPAVPKPEAMTIVKSGMVLIVEDDDDMRALASTQLFRLGYKVHAAATGRDALAIIEQQPQIMLLLTDLTLPGDMNGRDLAREILARRPHLRVIYMSGYSEEAARQQNHLDASIRLLQKPYSADELRSAIDEALH